MSDTAIEITENLRIPMRDGVTLSARVWRPKGTSGPLPVVIEAIPYRKSDGTVDRDATTHGVMAQAGYVCVRVDLRGSGSSEGFFDDEYSAQELDDIEDVIAWAAAASWSTGAVGMMGISWGGINGLLMAARRPEGLRAVISAAAVVDRYHQDIHAKGGCELTSNFGWAAQAMAVLSLPPDPATVEGDWRSVWEERLERAVFLPALWQVAEGKTDYWARTALSAGEIELPVLALAGHRDGYRTLPTALLGVAGPDSKAILGPWDHNYPNISSFGPWQDFAAMAVRWWDRWLKDLPNGACADPALSVYVLDGAGPDASGVLPGRWLSVDRWPSEDVAMVRYQLTSDGLGPSPGPLDAQVVPNLSCGKAAGEFFSRSGAPSLHPGDQQQDDSAAFCLETRPLEEEVILLGAVELDLTLSCDRPQGQVIARLCDVSPDGSARLISTAMLNLAFRAGFETPQAVEPGVPMEIGLRFDDTGYRLAPGHVLRLALSSSYWPFIWPAPALTRLTLQAGQLRLPIYTGAMGGAITDLPQPPAAPAVSRRLEEPMLSQSWSTDAGREIRERELSSGQVETLHNGLTRSGQMRETLSIDPNDPSSARMDVTWCSQVAWGDTKTETILSASMCAENGTVRLTGQLEAFHDETCIFKRVFEDRITNTLPQATDL